MFKTKAIYFCILFVVVNSTTSCKQTPAAITETIEFPKNITSLFNEIFQYSAFPCRSVDETALINSAWQYENQLFFIMQIPDYLCYPHSVVIVGVNEQQEWQIIEVFEGDVYGVAAVDQFLLIVSGWAIEGTFPYVLYSDNGINWNNLELPTERKRDCCFDQIERVWQTDEALWVDFYAQGDTPASRWALNLRDFKSGNHKNWIQLAMPGSEKETTLSYDDPVFQNTIGLRWEQIEIRRTGNSVSLKWKGLNQNSWKIRLPTLSP